MNRQSGFTLVELVVVVMILGILAAVATPKLLSTTKGATDHGLRQSLAVVRDAIERYAADNSGQLPGADGAEATLKTNLEDYLRGGFPKCPVGAKNDEVKVTTDAAGSMVGEEAPTKAWHYNSATGEFVINSNAATAGDPSITYDSL